MIDPIVVAKGLTKRYGTNAAVDRLDLELARGGVFGLLGPNGAGKTTTILMLLGLTEPTSGTVTVFGVDPLRNPLAVKRRIGYLPDAVGFYESLTGRQNLRFTARLNRIEGLETEAAIDSALAEVGLLAAGDQPVETYSRGMRQRLGIADALLKDPRLLILDEPTTAIDPEGVTEILALIRRLADDRNVAVLLSSHLLHQVESVCDRVAIFIGGRVVAVGSPHELAASSGGRERVEVTTDGNLDVATLLRRIPGVASVASGRRPGSWIADLDQGSTGRVVSDLVAGGAVVTGVHRTAEDLEEVYRRMLEKEKAVLETQAEVLDSTGGAWRVVARKELADHLLSARFTVLMAILGVTAAGSVYAASGGIREVAPQALDVPGLFLKLFTVTTDPVPFPFASFVGFLAPLLGIMFGFDAISGERSQNTLPRLLSHPIRRDEVIIGKFVAGISVIGLMLTALTVFVSGKGIFRLGISPTAAELGRLTIWLVFTVTYVGFWLALSIVASVTIRRAATAALTSVSVWLTLTLFGGLLFRALGSLMGGDDPLAAAQAEVAVSRLSPVTLFQVVTSLLLDPTQRAVGIVTYDQVDRAIVSNLSITQSLLVVWPQIVAVVAMTCIFFAVAFVAFMRQEVRA